jgi:hypothetical protein
MSAQAYLFPIVGAVLVASIVSATRESSLIIFVTLIGLLLVSIGSGEGQSPPKTGASPNAKQPTTRSPAKPKPVRRYQTYRISNIPISVTQDVLREALVETGTDGILLGFSCGLAVASTLSPKYRVATVTFAEAPDITELQKDLRICLGKHAALLRVDSNFFGLTPLHSLPHAQDNKVELVCVRLLNLLVFGSLISRTSIIAVVGLAGHGFGTWKAKGKADMWLRDFLPETVPDARIMTYGYDTELPGSQSEKSVVELSKNLLESIKTSRDETCVGHRNSDRQCYE